MGWAQRLHLSAARQGSCPPTPALLPKIVDLSVPLCVPRQALI